MERVPGRTHFAAVIAVEGDVLFQHGEEAGQITGAAGCQKTLHDGLVLVLRNLEARALVFHALLRSRDYLAAIGRALADHLVDLVVGTVEHFLEKKEGALDGRRSFQQQQKRHGKGFRQFEGFFDLAVEYWPGSQGPTYSSRFVRAERTRSMARRIIVVARYASGDSIAELRRRWHSCSAVLGVGAGAEHPVGHREQ